MDERLSKIEDQKQAALNQSNNAYGEMFQNNENLYNQQNSFLNQYESTQNDILDKQLAFQESLINQQKEKARQNMEAEQKRAKNDYTSYINPYGLQAESFASNGLLNSGVSETAKLGGYNTYQNRLASANKVMQDAFTQYDNDMNEARLNNDVQKAQNALEKLKMQLEYSENYYNNKNTLTQNQLQYNQSLDSEYFNRYNTEYNNIQQEKAREEAIRQWQAQFDYQKQQDALAQQNWEREYALSLAKNYGGSSGNGGYSLDNSDTSLSGESLSSNGLSIAPNPYTGTINADAKNGVFEWSENPGSGYQPNNIKGQKLTKTGDQYNNNGNIQNIWKTPDGRLWYWEGTLNKYIDITADMGKNLPFGHASGGGSR